MNAILTLKRQGYRFLNTWGACEIWQGPDGRRVLLDDDRIYNKQDIEQRIKECCGPDTAGHYLAVIHNWG